MTSAGAVRRRAAAACLVAVRGLVICALVCVVVGVWAPAARAEEVGTSPLEQITNDGQLEDTDAIPWNRYNIEAETDFGLTNLGGIGDVLWWSFTDLLFALTRLVTVFGIWLVEWAYSFRIVDLARGPAVNVAERLDDDIVGPLGLGDFAVFLAVFYSGYKLLRRQTGLGVSELVTSLVIAVLGAVVVANPAWLVDNLLPYFIDASGAIVQLGSDEEDVERSESVAANELVRPLVDELFDKLIVQPYDLISFGYLLEPECAAARDSHLRSEDWSYRDGDNIRDALRDADCDRAADFNEDATLERLGMALISLLVACIVCVLLIMVAVTVIGSQFVFLAVLALVPLWAVLAIVPGTLRQVGLRGVYTAGRSGIAIPAATFLLTLLLILSSEVLGDETIERLEERWLVLGIGASLLVTHRTALIDLASELVLRATQQLETKDPGGIGASLLSPANLPDSLVRRRFTEKSVDTVYGAMTGFPRRLRRRGGGGGGGLGGTGGGPRRRGRVGTGIAAGVAGLGTAGVAAAIATGGLSVAGLALGGAGALGFIGGAGMLLRRLNGPNYVSPRQRRRHDRREERRRRRRRESSDTGPQGPNQWPDPRTLPDPDPEPRRRPNADGRPTPDAEPRRRPNADGRPTPDAEPRGRRDADRRPGPDPDERQARLEQAWERNRQRWSGGGGAAERARVDKLQRQREKIRRRMRQRERERDALLARRAASRAGGKAGGGAAEPRGAAQKAIGPAPQHKAIGPAPQRKAIGPAPQRKAIGPAPQRKAIGPAPQRKAIGPAPPRDAGGGAGGAGGAGGGGAPRGAGGGGGGGGAPRGK